MKKFVFDLFYELIDLEKIYLNEFYLEVGFVEEVIKFSVYNVGKFL